ncbi:Ppx/GppA phosphatase family protein [Thermomonospora cellulosilytica]|uniref:Exopolyphosphatase/guanosine-5'-triphosphate, 3'-diphosphate pyrophosphatase n=1 Tax=Thermomonospora cellulosilytica TaxID=1411118 RepID=A0A7W3N2I0_9ACTN|nr:hypothetical protein [Thermomonospora cellulosilytica]MBA9006353.1 exopolyphosphatase/guanosine-5'-triphosphate,3'-diphosphate pyrophosphatase [Thermomonospora cellulosilytica]
MRTGVLDIGSNSAHLLVVDLMAGLPPLPVGAVKCPTRLAEAIGPDGTIEEPAVGRLVAAVRQAVEEARELEVDELVVFATSAVRDAANATEILGRIERACGVRPGFLSGEAEARLTFHAVRAWYGWSAGGILLADIGGGSLELAYGRAALGGAEPQVAMSLPLGAGRLTRRFLPDDPPRRKDLRRLRRRVEAKLERRLPVLREAVAEVPDRPLLAVATSRTFTQLAVLAGAPRASAGPYARRTLDRADLRAQIPRLARRPAERRARMRGVSRPRARQIVAGAIVAERVMAALDLTRVEICPWALREGVALHRLLALTDPEHADRTVLTDLLQPMPDAGGQRRRHLAVLG